MTTVTICAAKTQLSKLIARAEAGEEVIIARGKKPVVIETSEGDSIAIRPVGVLAQSFDHRAVDGAYSAAFLDRVRKLLETSHWVIEV